MKHISQQEFASHIDIRTIRRVYLAGQENSALHALIFMTERGEEILLANPEKIGPGLFTCEEALDKLNELGCFDGGMNNAKLDLSRMSQENINNTGIHDEISFHELGKKYPAIRNTFSEYRQDIEKIQKEQGREDNTENIDMDLVEKATTVITVSRELLTRITAALLIFGTFFIYLLSGPQATPKAIHLIQITLIGMLALSVLAFLFTIMEKINPDPAARPGEYHIWMVAMTVSASSTLLYLFAMLFMAA